MRDYGARGPHAGLPLARQRDDDLTSGNGRLLISCGWHGALFALENGLCLGGPCSGQSLTPWPVTIAGGWIITA